MKPWIRDTIIIVVLVAACLYLCMEMMPRLVKAAEEATRSRAEYEQAMAQAAFKALGPEQIEAMHRKWAAEIEADLKRQGLIYRQDTNRLDIPQGK